MSETDEGRTQPNEIGGLRIRSEELGFDRADMIECPNCGRSSPPNRFTCIYCSHSIDVPAEFANRIKPNLRALEAWEKGFNVVVIEKPSDNVDVAAAADLLSADPIEVRSIFDAGFPLPIARVETEKDALAVASALADLGVKGIAVSDEALLLATPPVRLRRIDFRGETAAFYAFNSGEASVIAGEDLLLIVPGIIAENKTHLLEKKGRRGVSAITDEAETSSDEAVLDIYCCGKASGFRVQLSGFDFSCLENDKVLVAAENMRRLAIRLQRFAPNSVLAGHYAAVRRSLSFVWEIERRNDSRGFKRSGFGKFEFGNTASSSNLTQFNKFSRLQRHLL